jgi:hypothetical protein
MEPPIQKPVVSKASQDSNVTGKPSRRSFLGKLGGAAVASVAVGAIRFEPAAEARTPQAEENLSPTGRAEKSYELRNQCALRERSIVTPPHPANGDEQQYSSKIGNYSKGLPHNNLGEVDLAAYGTLIQAVNSGAPADFEAITLGGNVKLVNPQSGLAFDLEGTDSHQLAIPPAPAVASAERAGEMVEDYWMALARDIPFSQYGNEPITAGAIADLNKMSVFKGAKPVTAGNLFRGFTNANDGNQVGPYISQFLWMPFQFGAIPVVQQVQTTLPNGAGGRDWMTDGSSWLAVQSGQGPFAKDIFDPQPRYLRNGRDISQWVHVDVLFEAYFNACIVLLDMKAPLNPGNPYSGSNPSKTQAGFGTFGAPHLKTIVAEVSTRALKAVWYQKWFVHRNERPEEYGGLVHNVLTGAANYPLHKDVLHSQAVQQVFAHNAAINGGTGTYYLPMAFPEGCPQHPSYGAGHATVAGACSTIVKAFFDETFVIPNPVVASDDGLSLLPYSGSSLTVGGEMNKIAANVGVGRNIAGVHWRSDYRESVLLGEKIAISVLRDQRRGYNEVFSGFTFTKFDGTKITV